MRIMHKHQGLEKLRGLVLAGWVVASLSGCTAMVVTSALTTATKAAVGVVSLPVKAVAGLATGDDDSEEQSQAASEQEKDPEASRESP
ncbi:MAG: hypothetical protein CMP96_12560 [Gammaproteobacteria bacterium]|nr:hypothetical protein [Gammaproteobacteria bacterium]